jgi:hypothetical protein
LRCGCRSACQAAVSLVAARAWPCTAPALAAQHVSEQAAAGVACGLLARPSAKRPAFAGGCCSASGVSCERHHLVSSVAACRRIDSRAHSAIRRLQCYARACAVCGTRTTRPHLGLGWLCCSHRIAGCWCQTRPLPRLPLPGRRPPQLVVARCCVLCRFFWTCTAASASRLRCCLRLRPRHPHCTQLAPDRPCAQAAATTPHPR